MTEKAKKDILEYLQCMVNTETPTPPKIVNDMLDLIPESVWLDDNAKILCPACKDGIFLREASLRILRKKYETMGPTEFRKHQDEITDHILRNRMFGIAISYRGYRVTKRSLYTCSDKYSNIDNIFFDESLGRYVKDKDGKEVEKQCFHFIENIDEVSKFFEGKGVKDMQFDVIIGNPPYQLNVGVEQESYAVPLYHKFIQTAQKLEARYISMIVPSRWFAGGRGLDEFREKMLHDTRLRVIHDYLCSYACFPNVEIKGGVCYFLWNRDEKGPCNIITHHSDKEINTATRPLLENGLDTFIRFNRGIPILNKVYSNKDTFASLVSPQTPFGLISSFKNYKKEPFPDCIKLYIAKGNGYIEKKQITKNHDLVDKYKIYITKSYGAGEGYPHQILNKPFIGEPGSCCTQTYLSIGPFETAKEAQNALSYIKTKFFRFMVLLKKNTQDAMRGVYQFVPMQNFNEEWTDEKLYKKYNINADEIAFIESMIRPMDINADENTIDTDTDDE